MDRLSILAGARQPQSRVFRSPDGDCRVTCEGRRLDLPPAQGVCQGARAGGEQGGVPAAAKDAAAGEGVDGVCRLDLQGR